MAEGASRHWMARRAAPATTTGQGTGRPEAAHRLAARIADLAWAGLRSVHAD